MRAVIFLLSTILSLSACAHSQAPVGEVSLTDRSTGDSLPVRWHEGQRWVAGDPGHRYSIRLRNPTAGRLLAVISVDGVNAVSGETAAWGQSGYVLEPGATAEIRGWRKSTEKVAAFEFTSLPDSYAARTGRPANVGVIGVAFFREAPAPAPQVSAGVARAPESRRDEPAQAAAAKESASDSIAPATRLGTGHGRVETSRVQRTSFERAQSRPDQILSIRYDSFRNLVAMGVIAQVQSPRQPEPFPGQLGFVPDPPRN